MFIIPNKTLAVYCAVLKTVMVALLLSAMPSVYAGAVDVSQKTVEKAPAFQDFTGKNCWIESANLYKMDPYLLFAVAMVESGLRPDALGENVNGSFDIGMMQINSWWFPTLRKYGIEKHHLTNPCVSIQVGAWVLAWNFHRLGYNWQAIGAYNAKDYNKRVVYANKVYDMYERLTAWATAYRDSYYQQFGVYPAYTPKPPKEWLRYKLVKPARPVAANGLITTTSNP